MKTQQINAYVPASAYLEGKQESVTPRFYEDFAILDPAENYRVVAARGLTLKSDRPLRFSLGESDFLETNLLRHAAVAVDTENGILLVLRHLQSHCGLLAATLPHGSKTAVAYALRCFDNKDVLLSPTVAAQAHPCKEAEEIYLHLAPFFRLCEEVFSPERSFDFRLHCAHVAQLAGCKINVTQLPAGHYPILSGDLARWTAFLLCLFLTLRGDSALGTAFQLEHADRQKFSMKISHQSEYQRKIPVTETIYRFLALPPFSDFRLSRTNDRFSIQAVLRRQHSTHLLRASDGFDSVIYIDLVLSDIIGKVADSVRA